MDIKYFHFSEINSTNKWALNNIDKWSKEGLTVISADYQTAGRGKLDRKWHSNKNLNLLASICFLIDEKDYNTAYYSLLTMLSVLKFCQSQQIAAQIKWPNDIILNDRKIAGILCQVKQLESSKAVVCGVGFNVNCTKEDLATVLRPATSLFIESRKLYDLTVVLNEVVSFMIQLLKRYQQEGFSPLLKLINDNLLHKLGDSVTVMVGQETLKAKFLKINFDGSMKVELNNGAIKDIYSAEIN